jgi:integrase
VQFKVTVGKAQESSPLRICSERRLRRTALQHPTLQGTVFHSTRKWFVTQCERTGTPEHFTASLVGHASARSSNRITYGLYSAGISDDQKRSIVDGIRLPLLTRADE